MLVRRIVKQRGKLALGFGKGGVGCKRRLGNALIRRKFLSALIARR